ncbi:Scamp3 [Columba guinea]|nr:Scamp3 [Columba guinea]
MAQRGGPAVLPDNPFQDPTALQPRPGPAALDSYNPFESGAEELNRKAEELDRRERELQNAALGGAATSTIALFLNFLSSLAWFCVDASSGSGFGLSILWALLYTPCSFVCWYRPMYKAFRSDSSFNFFVFFFVFFAQNVMYVLQAIGIPNWGFCGWILSLIALRKNTAVAVMMILVSLSFTAVAVLGIIMLKKIHSLYRRTGASFQKAQEEFAAGVFSNQAVRTAAANAAAGAATNAFRAP